MEISDQLKKRAETETNTRESIILTSTKMAEFVFKFSFCNLNKKF